MVLFPGDLRERPAPVRPDVEQRRVHVQVLAATTSWPIEVV